MLKLENVSKCYKEKIVLKSINFEFLDNHIYGICGENGSGKTVLLKLLCGLSECSSGFISWKNQRIGTDVERIENIGALIETPGFLPFLSAKKNLMLLAEMEPNTSKSDVVSSLEMLGLSAYHRSPVSTYSLGMRQKLGVAQAIMGKPELLILDEPTNSLDLKSIKDMQDIIVGLKQKGRVIIVVSHEQAYLSEICDSILKVEQKQLHILI